MQGTVVPHWEQMWELAGLEGGAGRVWVGV